MGHLDPYSGTEPRSWQRPDEPGSWQRPGEPRGWDRPGEPAGWAESPDGRPWPGSGESPRAWHPGVAPEAYPRSPASGSRPDDEPAWDNGRGTFDAAGHPPPSDPEVRGRRDDTYPPGAGPDAAGAGWPQGGGPELAGRPEAGDQPAERPRGARGRRRAGARRKSGQPAPAGRAGRNLPAAIGVGLFLAGAVLVPLFLYRPAFFGVVALAVSVGSWEMARAVRARDAHPPLVPLILGGLLMIGLAWRAGPDALSLGLLATVLAVMVWRLADGPAGYQRDLVTATLIAVYVPFLGGFAALLAVPPDGDWRVLVTLAAVVLSDTGGYAAGVFLGKHPMAPSVSPKKSWEGFAGSVIAAAAGSAVLLFVLFDVGLAWGALFGLAVSISAVLGDLGESMIKRDLGIKDMSGLLPGHGGLMDRLDSILFAVPVAYILLAIFAPAA